MLTTNNHPPPAPLKSIVEEMAAHIARIKRLPPIPIRFELGRDRWEALKAITAEASPTIEINLDRPRGRTFSGLEVRVFEGPAFAGMADAIYSDGSRRPL